MTWFTPYRIASALLVLFCFLHTAGGMLGQPSLGPEADAVFASMKAVQFDFNGSTSTWYGFWFGFGIMVSVFLLYSAIVAWQLDHIDPRDWPQVRTIAWGLAAAQACTAVLSWMYFFAGPGVISTLATVFLAVGAWRKGSP